MCARGFPFGPRGLVSGNAATIMQITGLLAIVQSWAFAANFVFITSTMAVVKTTRTLDAWRSHTDNFVREDASSVVLQIKWKLSLNGGRRWICFSATTTQLAATRRTRGRTPQDPQPHHLATDISVMGPMGYNPEAGVTQLMGIIGDEARLLLQNASHMDTAHSSSWRWLAATDPTAPPSRIRLQ